MHKYSCAFNYPETCFSAVLNPSRKSYKQHNYMSSYLNHIFEKYNYEKKKLHSELFKFIILSNISQSCDFFFHISLNSKVTRWKSISSQHCAILCSRSNIQTRSETSWSLVLFTNVRHNVTQGQLLTHHVSL